MTVLGAGLLWFGWFGFNAGSAVAANGLAANAFMVTNIAAAAATITWVLASYARTARSASSAPPAARSPVSSPSPRRPGFVTVGGALIIGLVAGGLCYSATLLRARSRVDDALDVFAVHGVGGMFGAVATGVFASTAIQAAYSGLLEGNPQQLVNQLIAVGATVAYAVDRHLRHRQGRRPPARAPGQAGGRGDGPGPVGPRRGRLSGVTSGRLRARRHRHHLRPAAVDPIRRRPVRPSGDQP